MNFPRTLVAVTVVVAACYGQSMAFCAEQQRRPTDLEAVGFPQAVERLLLAPETPGFRDVIEVLQLRETPSSTKFDTADRHQVGSLTSALPGLEHSLVDVSTSNKPDGEVVATIEVGRLACDIGGETVKRLKAYSLAEGPYTSDVDATSNAYFGNSKAITPKWRLTARMQNGCIGNISITF